MEQDRACLGALGVAEKLHVWKERYTGKRVRKPNRASEGLSRGFGFIFECDGGKAGPPGVSLGDGSLFPPMVLRI